MRNIDDYDAGFEGFLTTSDDDNEVDDNLDYLGDRRVIIDYDDFLDLAKENGALKEKLSYILKALRLGIDTKTILDLFDDEPDVDIDQLLAMKFFNGNDEDSDEENENE